MSERWRLLSDIPGFESFHGMRISESGSIQSCRTTGCKPKLSNVWKERKLTKANTGYLCFSIKDGKKNAVFNLHVVLMLAFGPPQPSEKHIVCHKDDVKTNNALDNLYWGTHRDNRIDAYVNKKRKTKLTAGDVLEIRALAESGISQRTIAAKFGTAQGCVSSIVRRQTWSHVRPVGD